MQQINEMGMGLDKSKPKMYGHPPCDTTSIEGRVSSPTWRHSTSLRHLNYYLLITVVEDHYLVSSRSVDFFLATFAASVTTTAGLANIPI